MKSKILLVDDECDIVKDINFMAFDEINYEIITQASPELPSLELLNSVDVIILDYNFNQKRTGIDFLVDLRKHKKYRHIPVIILSRADDFASKIRRIFKNYNITEYVSKTTEPQVFKTKVDFALESGMHFRNKASQNTYQELKAVISTFKIIVFRLIPRKYRKFLLLTILVMLMAGFLTSVPAVILGYLVDNLLADEMFGFSDALPFILVIMLSIIIREGMTVLRKYSIENICTQLAKQEKVELISHLLRVDLRKVHGMMSGALQGRITRGLDGLLQLLKLAFLEFFPVLFVAISAISVAIYKSCVMGISMLLVIPISYLIISWQISSQKGIRIELLRANEKVDGKVVELITCLESVRAANTEVKETNNVESQAELLRAKEIKHHIFMALFDSLKMFNEGVSYILVLIFSLFLAFEGIISKGDILTYSILYMSVMQPMRDMHRILDQSHESYIRVQDLLDLKSLPKDQSYITIASNKELKQADKSLALISVNNISFKYCSSDEEFILKDVSCEISPGQRIGIVGSSGCGKSTFIKLILRLLHYESGNISLKGRPLSSYTRKEISSLFGYVQQRPLIVSGTIMDNITYGNKNNFELNEIKKAAEKAMIHKEIINDLGGYFGIVQEGGKNLSGGQMQRIAISRLFLYKPEILILDEATAALDNINEQCVQESLESAMAGRTVIMIAHRLSTLRNCDRILVFDKGMIVEQGEYQELISNRGLFFKLHSVAESINQV
jgi:ATP-binding cassette, subfamily B, bacterial